MKGREQHVSRREVEYLLQKKKKKVSHIHIHMRMRIHIHMRMRIYYYANCSDNYQVQPN